MVARDGDRVIANAPLSGQRVIGSGLVRHEFAPTPPLPTYLLALAVGIVAVVQIGRPGSWLLLAGAILGVLGMIVTMLFNVPLNDHLDRVDLADAATEWQAYLSSWTAWNHVRTGSGLLAAVLMLIGLAYR